MNALLIEPFGGLAGDMLLAALLDLGDARFTIDDLRRFAGFLPGRIALERREVRRGALRATWLEVEIAETPGASGETGARGAKGAPAPARARLANIGVARRGHAPHAGAELVLGHAHGGSAHAHAGGQHAHRHLGDMLALAARAPLGGAAGQRASRVLERLGAAEARVHGLALDEVHFHEVGALDTLLDVCGACFALERLAVASVFSTPPLVGSGTVECAHGTLPVPAPGTAELLRGLPFTTGASGERLTPTGAALLAELTLPLPSGVAFSARALGYGAGTRDPADGPPNCARVQLGTVLEQDARAEAWLGECNLDDATGEEIGFLLERLRGAGALEAWSAPVQMKKDRPGAVVSFLARGEGRAALEREIVEHSPALGLRWSRLERAEFERASVEVELHGARVRVVRRVRPGAAREADFSPEYEDLAALARAGRGSLRELERAAIQAALERVHSQTKG